MIYRMNLLVLLAAIVGLTAATPHLLVYPAGPEHTQKIGASILFTCMARGLSGPGVNPNLRWFGNDGQEITDRTGRLYIEQDGQENLKLYITAVQNQDAGTYTCRGTLEGNQVEKSIKLSIFKDITFDHAPSPQHPKVFDDALLECVVSGQPQPDVSWRYRGQKIQTGDRYLQQQGGLKVRNMTEEDNGVYTCRAEVLADGRMDMREITVIAHIPPKITSPPPADSEGIEGAEATIECKASGKPPPKYEFYKDNSQVPVRPTERIVVDENAGAIHFRPLSKVDDGRYMCKAFNDVGDDAGEGNLFVIVRPKIRELRNVTQSEGLTKSLICETDADPAPEMKFRKVGSTFDYEDGDNEGGRIRVISSPNRLELKISQLEPDDSSNYTCKATNTGGFVEQNGTITVEFRPRFRPDHETTFYNWAGKTRNLTCHSLAEPEPYIDWIMHGKILENNETYKIYPMGRNSALQVKVRDEDQQWIYGKYTCRSKNKMGNGDLDINMLRASVPHQPKQVSAKERSPTMVILTIVPPEDNGGVEVYGYRVEYESKSQEFRLDEEILIENLRPSTTYIFRVRAKNEVGVSNPLEYSHRTEPIREPYPIVIQSESEGLYPYEYTLMWEKPKTGGLPIKEYEFQYRRVKVRDGTTIIEEPLEKWQKRVKDDDETKPMLFYKLESLKPDTHYQVEIRARNDINWSPPNLEFVFWTADDPNYKPDIPTEKPTSTEDNEITDPTSEMPTSIPITKPTTKDGKIEEPYTKPEFPTAKPTGWKWKKEVPPPPTKTPPTTIMPFPIRDIHGSGADPLPTTRRAGLSTGAVIGIVFAVFFIFLIIVDISCYFMNNCGVLMCICIHLCGKEEPSAKEKQMEEGESKPVTKQPEQPIEEAKVAPETETTPLQQGEAEPEEEEPPLPPPPEQPASENEAEEHLNKPEEDGKEALKEEIRQEEEVDEKVPLTDETKC